MSKNEKVFIDEKKLTQENLTPYLFSLLLYSQ